MDFSPPYPIIYWVLVALCPDWWPPRFRPPPREPDPFPPPPIWKLASVLVGVAAAFVITRGMAETGRAGIVELAVSGVFAYVGARATLSIGGQLARPGTDVGNP